MGVILTTYLQVLGAHPPIWKLGRCQVLESYEVPLKDTFSTGAPLVVTVVAGEVLEEFILDACFWNGWVGQKKVVGGG